MQHSDLPDRGEYGHDQIDTLLRQLKTRPLTVTGKRSDGTALLSLLTQLAALGLITDSTTAS